MEIEDDDSLNKYEDYADNNDDDNNNEIMIAKMKRIYSDTSRKAMNENYCFRKQRNVFNRF